MVKQFVKRFLFGVAVAVGVSACASYAVRTVPILPPDIYQFQEAVGDVVLIADLYDTTARYQSVFDTAPSYERGYLGINVLVFNNSSSGVTIDPANVTCLATSGTEHSPIAAEQVAEQVLRSTTGRFLAGGVIAAGSSRGANDRIRADFANKALRFREFPPAYPQCAWARIRVLPQRGTAAGAVDSRG